MTIDVTYTKYISNIFDLLKYQILNIDYQLLIGQIFEYNHKTYKCISNFDNITIVREV